MEKPKKQFKSQSVNDLFRQQAASKAASSLPSSARLERSKSPGNTKLRLVTKKSRSVSSITLSKLKKPTSATPSPGSSKSTPEATSTGNSSPLAAPQEDMINKDKTDIEDPIQTLPETIGKFINGNNSNAFESNIQYEQQQNNANKPSKSRFNWDDNTLHQDNSNNNSNGSLWTSNESFDDKHSSTLNSLQDSTPWSPNSKISSFRKSIGSSLTQSPLNQPFFNDLTQNSTPFSSRQNSAIFTSLPTFSRNETSQQSNIPSGRQNSTFGEFWKSPSIWNSHEERQLSTKSDSVINWSPFDIEALSLDDNRMNHSTNDLRHQSSFDIGSRSRFFPIEEQIPEQQHGSSIGNGLDGFSPVNSSISNTLASPQHRVQHQQQQQQPFPMRPQIQLQPSVQVQQLPQHLPRTPLKQPTPMQFTSPEFNVESPSISQVDQREELPKTLIVTSSSEVEPPLGHDTNLDKGTIPISLPLHSRNSFISQDRPSAKTLDYELPHYPEGFSSTFYKRGINNFMFIRELQPKIITSKYSDSVEVRLTFPTWDEDYRLKSSRVDIDVRELDGKLGGLKVSKPAPVKKAFRGGFNKNLVYNKR